MQLIIDLTPEQETALNYAAAKASTPERVSPDGKVVPAVIVKPDEYLRARFDAVLTSYVEQARNDDAQAVVEAFEAASDADVGAVFAALKIERPTTTSKGVEPTP